MKKRFLVLTLAAVMLFGTVSGIGGFATAYADTPATSTHTHVYGSSEIILYPTEAKNGVMRYYCTAKKDGKACGAYYDELIPDLPDVYVSKFRHKDDGLNTRITIAQDSKVVGDELSLTFSKWNAKLMADQYHYNWEDSHIRTRSLEFKVEDVGIGTFNKKVKNYSLTVPVTAITGCEEDGAVVVYLTTGAAMVRLGKDATAALVENAEESIGIQASCDGDKLNVELTVDGKVVDTPNGVEMLYWVKDAGDEETASEKLLASVDYMNFDTDGDFDLIFVESLNGVVNCNH